MAVRTLLSNSEYWASRRRGLGQIETAEIIFLRAVKNVIKEDGIRKVKDMNGFWGNNYISPDRGIENMFGACFQHKYSGKWWSTAVRF